MIIFVGEKPSSKNKNKDVAFVGTPSYKRLLSWIYECNISLNNVFVFNMDQVTVRFNYVVCSDKDTTVELIDEDVVVALGDTVGKYLTARGIKHIQIPHPSPRNRLWNDPKNEKEVIKKLKKEIK